MDEGKWDLSLVDQEELQKSQATLVYGQMKLSKEQDNIQIKIIF